MAEDQIPTDQSSNGKKSARLQSIALIAAFVLFLFFVFWGFRSGTALGKSKATYQSAAHIYDALQFYYKDQGRYPSADQFYNQSILTAYNYIGNLPKPDDATGKCAPYQQFIYSQPSSDKFVLQFCLLSKVAGYSAGVHQITESGSK